MFIDAAGNLATFDGNEKVIVLTAIELKAAKEKALSRSKVDTVLALVKEDKLSEAASLLCQIEDSKMVRELKSLIEFTKDSSQKMLA